MPSKTRVTFRIAPELAGTLRSLPNQTVFVEEALKSALGRSCPACEGTGRIPQRSLTVSDFRRSSLPRLDQRGAIQLKGLVRLARGLAASRLDLAKRPASSALAFTLHRGSSVLMRGTLDGNGATFDPN